MRPLLLVTALLTVPVTAFAQSTVGNVPSNPNPNAMPAVDGSSAPTVSTAAPAKTSTGKASTSTHKTTHKKASPPQ